MRQLGRYPVTRNPRHERPEANQKALRRLCRGSDHGAMPAQDRQVEVPVCSASHPLAYANARHAVRVCDLVDVDTAPDRRDCGVDVLYVVGLPRQDVARQDSLPRTTQPAAGQEHAQVAESSELSGRLESSRYLRSSQAQIGAATPGAALAGQNRVVATRQGLPILARLDCKYVSHHVPLDGPGVERYGLSGAVSLFTGRRRSGLGPSPT